MADRPDDVGHLSRSTLCELAEIERGKHVRWTTQPRALLPNRDQFTTLDLVRAAMLDELNTVLKPAKAARIWRRIRSDVDLPGNRLDVVVHPATCEATVCRSDDELIAALPRRAQVIIVPLHERAQRALSRLHEFRASEAIAAPSSPAAEVTPLQEREANST